jgi:RHH-type proline utilization regulon transcriptional repressor/proline dehydrogenase/delta 1-pyrroline-5-carboxylate dehydrogenase
VAPHVLQDGLAGLEAAVRSDELAWQREFGREKDVSGLGVERNVFRYRPAPVHVRAGDDLVDAARVLLAARRAGADVTVSSPVALPDGLAPGHVVEDTGAWLARMAAERPSRVRLLAPVGEALSAAVEGDPDVAVHDGEVTWSGRVELLPFLREQAVTITTHRFGNHDPAFDRVLPRR